MAEEAIQDGDFDSEFNAAHPASVYLRVNVGLPGSPSWVNCSGTLVSPRWVMTAAHCVDKTDNGIHRSSRDWYAYVSPLGNQTGAPGDLSYSKTLRTFKHTFKSGLDLIPYLDAPTEPFEDRDTDIALIRLDERVPHPEGLHAVLPTPNACGTICNGRLVGFSPKGYDGELGSDEGGDPGDGYGTECAPESGGWRRRRGPSDVTWLRDDDFLDAAQYIHRFSAPSGQACTAFAGIGTGGDSGGSLYKANSGVFPGLLCGVISGDGPENDDDNGVTTYSDYHASATDHLFNIAWIDDILREGGFNPGAPGQGFVEDSWESRNNGVDDADGDGIAFEHDNCPSVSNPEQLTTFDDPEPPAVAVERPGDGIGLACDVCTGQQDSDSGVFGNINREVEYAVAGYPVEPTSPDDFNRVDIRPRQGPVAASPENVDLAMIRARRD